MWGCLQQYFNSTDRLRIEEHITTDRTNIRRYVINNDYLSLMAYGVYDLTLLMFSGAPFNTAFHSLDLHFLVRVFGDANVFKTGLSMYPLQYRL